MIFANNFRGRFRWKYLSHKKNNQFLEVTESIPETLPEFYKKYNITKKVRRGIYECVKKEYFGTTNPSQNAVESFIKTLSPVFLKQIRKDVFCSIPRVGEMAWGSLQQTITYKLAA